MRRGHHELIIAGAMVAIVAVLHFLLERRKLKKQLSGKRN